MLTRYRVVNAQGLRAVSFQGRTYVLADLTDAEADVLYEQTHVLEKLPPPPAAAAKRTRKARPANPKS